MVLFTLLHKMRRKRTRPSSSPSTSATASQSSPSSQSSSDTSALSSPSSHSSSSSEDERPLRRNSRSTVKVENKQKRRTCSPQTKPPRKKLKTMNLNGPAPTSNGANGGKLRRPKSLETTAVEKAKQRHREAAAAKMKRQVEQQVSKIENLNPAKQQRTENGKAAKDSGSSKSAASSSTSKTVAAVTVGRQNSVASSDTQSKSRQRIHVKTEAGRGRKTDPEVIFRLFNKPSQIYEVLAARQRERPIILSRNLSYLARPKKAKLSVHPRFKLPPCLVANEEVLRDQSNNPLLTVKGASNGTKSPNNRHSTTTSPNRHHNHNPKSNNLHLVLCRVIGSLPGQRGAPRRSVGSLAGKTDSIQLDVAISRTHVGKNLETKTQQDTIRSKLPVDFVRVGTNGLNNAASDEDYLDCAKSSQYLYENSVNTPKVVVIEGNHLYPPNGYTQGRAIVRLRAVVDGAGWQYAAEMEVTRDRDVALQNGFYSIYFRSMNADDLIGSRCPHLLLAAYWSPENLTREQIFGCLRRELVRETKTPSISRPINPLAAGGCNCQHQNPKPEPKQEPATSPTAQLSPSRSFTSRSRIVRVVFWLSDPSAGGPGICASVSNPFQCPWCHKNCRQFLALLRHLRCWHPRFSFVLQAERVARVADILVTINRRYEFAEEYRHPPTLAAEVPLVKIKKPIKRLQSSQLIWFSANGKHRRMSLFHKASTTALAEFRRPESDVNPGTVVMVSGHMRTYYHSQTCLPMTPDEFHDDCDSDAEEPPWITENTWRLLNDFTDVNAGEKIMMNLWNRFMYSERFFAQRSLFPACLAFVDQFGQEVAQNNILLNFRLHLSCLVQNNLLTAPQVYAVMVRLQKRLDESSGPTPSSSSTSTNSAGTAQRPLRKSLSSS